MKVCQWVSMHNRKTHKVVLILRPVALYCEYNSTPSFTPCLTIQVHLRHHSAVFFCVKESTLTRHNGVNYFTYFVTYLESFWVRWHTAFTHALQSLINYATQWFNGTVATLSSRLAITHTVHLGTPLKVCLGSIQCTIPRLVTEWSR